MGLEFCSSEQNSTKVEDHCENNCTNIKMVPNHRGLQLSVLLRSTAPKVHLTNGQLRNGRLWPHTIWAGWILIGITLYPWLSVATPSEIPDDYFSPLNERIDGKPIAITETGWPGENLGLETAWEASSEAQISFIYELDRVLGEVDLRILNWLHLNQMSRPEGNQTFWQVFSSISLRDIEGNKRPVYDIWMNFSP